MDFAVYTRETHKLGRSIYCCFEIRFAEWALSLLFYDFPLVLHVCTSRVLSDRTAVGDDLYVNEQRTNLRTARYKIYARFICAFCDAAITTFIVVASRKRWHLFSRVCHDERKNGFSIVKLTRNYRKAVNFRSERVIAYTM